jgi:hypothetical protein
MGMMILFSKSDQGTNIHFLLPSGLIVMMLNPYSTSFSTYDFDPDASTSRPGSLTSRL